MKTMMKKRWWIVVGALVLGCGVSSSSNTGASSGKADDPKVPGNQSTSQWHDREILPCDTASDCEEGLSCTFIYSCESGESRGCRYIKSCIALGELKDFCDDSDGCVDNLECRPEWISDLLTCTEGVDCSYYDPMSTYGGICQPPPCVPA